MATQHNQPGFTDQSLIRNFCIIAHIDHGKSTVADRILQLSGIVPEREMRDRFLDRMDIEQERGITIKSQAVRVPWTFDGTEYTLGMIDTPGHVDFTYEVSRALAACEGAVLLVDATQGIEAQTLSNLYMAIDHNLAIIPVLNKIDLPSAEPDKHAEEIAGLIGCEPSDVLRGLRQNRRGRDRPARPDRDGRARPQGRSGRPGPRADLRFGVRLVPWHRDLHPHGRRRTAQPREAAHDGHRHDPRSDRDRRDQPGHDTDQGARRRRGRLRDHRREGREPVQGRRYDHRRRQGRHRTAAGLPRSAADGVRRPVPDRQRPVSGAARRARQAQAQRRGAHLRAGDLGGAGLRLPLRLPGVCCTWRSSPSAWNANSDST